MPSLVLGSVLAFFTALLHKLSLQAAPRPIAFTLEARLSINTVFL
jgi:hypothetical protein